MSTKARVLLTVALGVFLGLATWLGTDGFSPSAGVEDVFDSAPAEVAALAFGILVPLAVGRWWVVASIAGRVVALAILELTGHLFHNTDGWEQPLGPVSLMGLVWTGLLMLILVGARSAFDLWRGRRTATNP